MLALIRKVEKERADITESSKKIKKDYQVVLLEIESYKKQLAEID
jgi:hypothetical protein